MADRRPGSHTNPQEGPQEKLPTTQTSSVEAPASRRESSAAPVHRIRKHPRCRAGVVILVVGVIALTLATAPPASQAQQKGPRPTRARNRARAQWPPRRSSQQGRPRLTSTASAMLNAVNTPSRVKTRNRRPARPVSISRKGRTSRRRRRALRLIDPRPFPEATLGTGHRPDHLVFRRSIRLRCTNGPSLDLKRFARPLPLPPAVILAAAVQHAAVAGSASNEGSVRADEGADPAGEAQCHLLPHHPPPYPQRPASASAFVDPRQTWCMPPTAQRPARHPPQESSLSTAHLPLCRKDKPPPSAVTPASSAGRPDGGRSVEAVTKARSCSPRPASS